MDRISLLRVLDANLNRGREALRVIEEASRLGEEDVERFQALRDMRHHLARLEIAMGVTPQELTGARDSESDPGRALPPPDHPDLDALITANFRRLQEACRVLEEYARLLGKGADLAGEIRFLAYDLQKRVAAGDFTRQRLAGSLLCVLVGGTGDDAALTRQCESAIEGGADMVQLRDYRGPDGSLLSLCDRLASLCRDHDRLFVVNDRFDVALLCGAHGVHLGQGDLSPGRVREVVGKRLIIGVSTHDDAELDAAKGADYVGVGTVFPSSRKPERPSLGVDDAARLFKKAASPAFPIGGITRKNIATLSEKGVYRAAISGGVVDDPDPAAATRELRALLAAAAPRSC